MNLNNIYDTEINNNKLIFEKNYPKTCYIDETDNKESFSKKSNVSKIGKNYSLEEKKIQSIHFNLSKAVIGMHEIFFADHYEIEKKYFKNRCIENLKFEKRNVILLKNRKNGLSFGEFEEKSSIKLYNLEQKLRLNLFKEYSDAIEKYSKTYPFEMSFLIKSLKGTNVIDEYIQKRICIEKIFTTKHILNLGIIDQYFTKSNLETFIIKKTDPKICFSEIFDAIYMILIQRYKKERDIIISCLKILTFEDIESFNNNSNFNRDQMTYPRTKSIENNDFNITSNKKQVTDQNENFNNYNPIFEKAEINSANILSNNKNHFKNCVYIISIATLVLFSKIFFLLNS
ncbi:hypothetical protein GVAV_000996 [Gurleya vavrai]